MAYRLITLFVTLVLACSVLANPHEHSPSPQNADDVKKDGPDQTLEDQNMVVTPAPPVPESTDQKFYYPFKQSVSPHFGIMTNTQDANEGIEYFLGFNYLFFSAHSPHWELSADLASNALGFISLSRRWILQERSSFRPYWKLGLTHQILAKDNLATFMNKDNYFALGSIGLEDLLKTPMSVRIELEVIAGLADTFAMLSLGYSWGW